MFVALILAEDCSLDKDISTSSSDMDDKILSSSTFPKLIAEHSLLLKVINLKW